MTTRDKAIEAGLKAEWDTAARVYPDNGRFEDQPDWLQDEWRNRVAAAFDAFLAAISEPDEGMLEAGCDTLNNEVSWRGKDTEPAYPCHLRPVFSAMIGTLREGV